MPKAALLAIAIACAAVGIAWLALAMEVHWQQVFGADGRPGRRGAIGLRLLGATALVVSLLVCLRADHASIAVLVWVMSLAGASLAVAFTLAWRPHWLAWLAWPLAGGRARPR